MKRLFKPDGRFCFIKMDDKSNKSDERLDRIDGLVDGVLEGTDLFRVETRLGGSGKVPKVDIFIDGDEGVTVDQCAQVSRSLRAAILLEGLFGQDFRIDVSSPGLGRPLRLPRQYRRHLGRQMKVVIKGPGRDELAPVSGKLIAAEEAGITIELEDDTVEFRFDEIEKAVVTPSL